MILTYSNIVKTKSLGGVSLRMNSLVLSHFVILKHVGVIFLLRKPLLKFCSVDFIGPLFLKRHKNIAKLAIDVKS
jgi:hypothetical protein